MAAAQAAAAARLAPRATAPLGAAGSFRAISGSVFAVGTEVTVGVAVSAPTSVVDPRAGVGAGVSVSTSSSPAGGRVGTDTGGSLVVVTTTGGEVVGAPVGIDMDMDKDIDMDMGDEADGADVSFGGSVPFGGSVSFGGSVPSGGSVRVAMIDMLRGNVGGAVSFGFLVLRTVGE